MKMKVHAMFINGNKKKEYVKTFNRELNEQERKSVKIELCNRNENNNFELMFIEFKTIA